MQPLFLLMAFMFTFIIQMSEVVIERELKLRQSMATMGMLDSVHSFCLYLANRCMACVSVQCNQAPSQTTELLYL